MGFSASCPPRAKDHRRRVRRGRTASRGTITQPGRIRCQTFSSLRTRSIARCPGWTGSNRATPRKPAVFPAYPPEIHKLYQRFIPRFLSCCTALRLHDSRGRATVRSPQGIARSGAGRDGRGGWSGLARALTNPVGTRREPGADREGMGSSDAGPELVVTRHRGSHRSARVGAATGPESLATGGTGQEGIRRHRKAPRKDRVRAPDAFSWPVGRFLIPKGQGPRARTAPGPLRPWADAPRPCTCSANLARIRRAINDILRVSAALPLYLPVLPAAPGLARIPCHRSVFRRPASRNPARSRLPVPVSGNPEPSGTAPRYVSE
jgi:hypothetical protein